MPAEFQSGAVASCPFTIDYSTAMMNQIRMAAMDAFFAIPRGGVEIGGILFGAFEEGRLRIQAFRIAECEHAAGPSFILSEADRARFTAILASEDRRPGGWFRSRTRRISLSEADVSLFDTYFPEPSQVVLILRPEVTRPARAGFFFREADGALRVESSYSEFALEGSPAGSRIQPPEAPAQLKLPAAPPAPRQYARPLWILVLCLCVAAASLAAREYLAARAPANQTLLLDVLDRSGQLQLQWDRSARPIQRARGAKLEITDGAGLLLVDLKAAQLQNGSVYYTRVTERVDIRMTLLEANGKSTEEYAVFCGRLP